MHVIIKLGIYFAITYHFLSDVHFKPTHLTLASTDRYFNASPDNLVCLEVQLLKSLEAHVIRGMGGAVPNESH